MPHSSDRQQTQQGLSQFNYANLSHMDSMEGLPTLEAAPVKLWSVDGIKRLTPGLSTVLIIALSALFWPNTIWRQQFSSLCWLAWR